MFSGCTVLPDSKETERGSSDPEASPSAGKNTGVVLVPCSAWKCVPTTISGGVDISEGQKLLQGLVPHGLTAYLSIFNQFKLNELWSYYQKHLNQVILNCTTF